MKASEVIQTGWYWASHEWTIDGNAEPEWNVVQIEGGQIYLGEISRRLSEVPDYVEFIGPLQAPAIDREGCGSILAPGQHWYRCGETDMGQSLPALCTECGGKYKRAVPERKAP